jgi:hypothetical protein
MNPAGNDHAHHPHHHLGATSRLFRLRIRLSSAMWLPVLAANVVAVALAIALPVLTSTSETSEACRSRRPRRRRSSGPSPEA